MILLVTTTFAQDLPWECPPITDTSDAAIYRDNDGALNTTFNDLYDAAYAYWDDGCAWVETTEVDHWETTLVRVCDTGDVVVTWEEWLYEEYGVRRDSWTLVVDVATGETWTRIAVSHLTDAWDASSGSYGEEDTWTASWTGGFGGLADDGWFIRDVDYDTVPGMHHYALAVQTPACSYSWEEYNFEYEVDERVSAVGHKVEVESVFDSDCGLWVVGEYDDVSVGAVDPDTWERDLTDADLDGWPAGPLDCDDADATRGECFDDIPYDGIDQDCDGADYAPTDVDGDGHDDPAFGGDDCDDRESLTFPGADDPGGDGVDQDCDGADDVDFDGDGFTVDGDDGPPDCDDINAPPWPGFPEVPYDGIDQDCSGADLTDVDLDGYDARRVGGPDCADDNDTIGPHGVEVECDGIDQDCDGTDACPPPSPDPDEPPTDEDEDEGCGGGAGWLLLTPLLGVRRKGRR